MLSLRPLQRALDSLYRLGVSHAVDDFVRPMRPDSSESARREVVLVSQSRGKTDVEIAVLLDPDVSRVLQGERVAGLSRFSAWCLALEGVSHFQLLAFRAGNDRSVSQLELEIQADVDKFAIALVDRIVRRAPGEAHALSKRLRVALFSAPRFRDPPDTVRGRRYRLAHRMAARYAAYLERKYVRDGRCTELIDELRKFYRAGLAGKWAMVDSGCQTPP